MESDVSHNAVHWVLGRVPAQLVVLCGMQIALGSPTRGLVNRVRKNYPRFFPVQWACVSLIPSLVESFQLRQFHPRSPHGRRLVCQVNTWLVCLTPCGAASLRAVH